MNKNNLITLGDLSRELGFNKSKLAYYTSFGLIRPIQTIGKTMVLDKNEAIRILDFITNRQKKGKKLAEIKKELLNE